MPLFVELCLGPDLSHAQVPTRSHAAPTSISDAREVAHDRPIGADRVPTNGADASLDGATCGGYLVVSYPLLVCVCGSLIASGLPIGARLVLSRCGCLLEEIIAAL